MRRERLTILSICDDKSMRKLIRDNDFGVSENSEIVDLSEVTEQPSKFLQETKSPRQVSLEQIDEKEVKTYLRFLNKDRTISKFLKNDYCKMVADSDESTVGLIKKKTYTVSGVPENACAEFHINLITDEGDKAFRFSAMFPRMVVLNSCFGGSWGREEVIEGEFPFERNKTFNVAIVSEPSAFQVFVNGSHFCAFAHRIDPNVIKGLKIEGKVILMGVRIK